MNNQKEIDVVLKRIDLCDLMLACTSAWVHSGDFLETRNGKWLVLHNKIRKILDDYDKEKEIRK